MRKKSHIVHVSKVRNFYLQERFFFFPFSFFPCLFLQNFSLVNKFFTFNPEDTTFLTYTHCHFKLWPFTRLMEFHFKNGRMSPEIGTGKEVRLFSTTTTLYITGERTHHFSRYFESLIPMVPPGRVVRSPHRLWKSWSLL